MDVAINQGEEFQCLLDEWRFLSEEYHIASNAEKIKLRSKLENMMGSFKKKYQVNMLDPMLDNPADALMNAASYLPNVFLYVATKDSDFSEKIIRAHMHYRNNLAIEKMVKEVNQANAALYKCMEEMYSEMRDSLDELSKGQNMLEQENSLLKLQLAEIKKSQQYSYTKIVSYIADIPKRVLLFILNRYA